jgi:hypothetical protein
MPGFSQPDGQGVPEVRISFAADLVLVEDGPARQPAPRIIRALSDLVPLLVVD